MSRAALRSIELSRVDIPLRVRFAHASAQRDRTESVLVVVTTAAGVVGYGEGCPRHYVTGEHEASVLRFFAEYADAILAEVMDIASLRDFASAHRAVQALCVLVDRSEFLRSLGQPIS